MSYFWDILPILFNILRKTTSTFFLQNYKYLVCNLVVALQFVQTKQKYCELCLNYLSFYCSLHKKKYKNILSKKTQDLPCNISYIHRTKQKLVLFHLRKTKLCNVELSDFRAVTTEEVRELATKPLSKSCQLDSLHAIIMRDALTHFCQSLPIL